MKMVTISTPYTHNDVCAHPISKVSLIALIVLAIGLTLCMGADKAYAFDKKCRNLYRAKQFLKAADCFKGMLGVIDKNKALGQLAATLKNKYLRDAAVSFSRAGDNAKDTRAKAHHKEQAIRVLDDALARPYCKKPGRCSNHRKLRLRFKKEVQYSRLAVFSGDDKAEIKVTGYQYSQTKKGNFNEELRPGKYLVVLSKGGKEQKRKEIEIKPLTNASLNMQTAKIKIKKIIVAKKIPPLVLAGYIGGGVLLLGGIALAVVGYVSQSSLNTCRQDASCAQDAQAYDREFDQAGAFIAVGYATAVGGIIFLAGTATAQVFANRNPTNRPPPQLSKSTSLGSFGWPH